MVNLILLTLITPENLGVLMARDFAEKLLCDLSESFASWREARP
jgi:hypothetical protein